MAWFPMFVDLEQRPGLLVGGGRVALRKAEKLLPYGPRLRVVAPALCPELLALPGLTTERRPFAPEDVEGMTFVIAATGDRQLNREIALLCREKNIPVNVADSREESSFLFPALVQRGELSVGITTGGNSPTAARWVKEQIEAALPEQFDRILTRLGREREEILNSGLEEGERSRRLRELFFRLLEENEQKGETL